jgi:hypothetical protein
MNCDLCNHENTTGRLLCVPCADMIQRLIAVNQRMSTREMCEAERLAHTACSSTASMSASTNVLSH